MGPLVDYIPASANINTNNLLCDLSTKEGNWNFDLLQVWLLEEIIHHIRGIPPPQPLEGPDRLSWRRSSIGAFSIKSSFRMIKEDSWDLEDELWKRAWNLQGPQRVRFFIWIVLKQRLLMNTDKTRRGIVVDSSCPVCGHEIKDTLHIVRDCTLAKGVWNQVVSRTHQFNFSLTIYKIGCLSTCKTLQKRPVGEQAGHVSLGY